MTSRALYRGSRGDVVRGLGKTWEDFPNSISDAIYEVMEKVEGAELVCSKIGRMGDEYTIVYNISPEGVTCHIDLSMAVGRTIVGPSDKLDLVEKKLRDAFKF